MDQEHKETIERTIVELESQQMAVQQLVAEALDDLEVLYSEIEEHSRLMAEAPPVSEETGGVDQDALDQASQELQALQQDIASLQEERRELESQLRQLRQELEEAPLAVAAASDSPETTESTDGSNPLLHRPTHALLNSTAVPNAAAIHAPFERLREQLSAS